MRDETCYLDTDVSLSQFSYTHTHNHPHPHPTQTTTPHNTTRHPPAPSSSLLPFLLYSFPLTPQLPVPGPRQCAHELRPRRPRLLAVRRR